MKAFFTVSIRLVIVCMLTVLSVLYTVKSSSAAGTIIYVDDSAMGADNGTSWADAYIDLQSALSTAVSGDQIWVAAGTYKPTSDTDPTISFDLESGVEIYGGFTGTESLLSERDLAANVTLLSGDLNGDDVGFTNNEDNSYHVIDGNTANSTAILDGFTITGGNAQGSSFTPAGRGGGVYIDGGNPTLSNLIVKGNRAVNGGGIHSRWNSDLSLTDISLEGNIATNQGGGLYISNTANLQITNLTSAGNQASVGGGMVIGGGDTTGVLTNITVSGNTAGIGGGVWNILTGSLTFTNITVHGNTATTGTNVGGIFNDNSSPVFKNMILWGNSILEMYNHNSTPTITDSVIEGSCPNAATCTNRINLDPQLGPLQDNGGITQTMALGPASSALDKGLLADCPSTDQRGVSRPQGAGCDIGAFEYEYTFGSVLYVKPGGLTGGGCNSWSYACELRYALSVATFGQQIWVAAGTYTPTSGTDRTISFALVNSVEVYGGFVGTETSLAERAPGTNLTILSGDLNGDDSGFINNSENSYHVVVGSGTDVAAVLDGFTITAGNADAGGFGFIPNNRGGGIYNDGGSPTLTNLTVVGNRAVDGGGIYNRSNSHPTLINVTISGNVATTSGGGMSNLASNPTLTNVTISGNSSLDTAGGILNSSSHPTLTNVTISGNSALQGGGLYNASSSPTLANVILWGNGAAMKNLGNSAPIVQDSIVQDGCPSASSCTNVIDSDPVLGEVQDNGGSTPTMALGGASPAIDTGGLHSICASDDQRGVARPQGAKCDIGAYEYEFAQTSVRYVKPSALSSGACDSWDNACSLIYGLFNAVSGQQVWVMTGTYRPTDGADRTLSLGLRDGVEIYGGFAGTESSLNQRNWTANPSILSGDIGVENDASDNSWHVISAGTDETAVLDGFTITSGNATGPGTDSNGGGMLLYGTPVLRNLTITGNTALTSGAGLYAAGSPSLTDVTFSQNTAMSGTGIYFEGGTNASLTRVTFINNTASASGGGIYNLGNNLTLTDVTFQDNSANEHGGGMFNHAGSLTLTGVTFDANSAALGGGGLYSQQSTNTMLTNVTFSGNTAGSGGALAHHENTTSIKNVTFSGNSSGGEGGAIYEIFNTTLTLENTIVWANGTNAIRSDATGSFDLADSIVEGGCPVDANCTNVIDNDPLLDELQDNGGPTQTFALLAGSPAIDAGTNIDCPATDQRGVARPYGDSCDIGAYEYAVEPTQPGPDFVVNTSADTDDGSCDLFGQGAANQDCTLREAINAANHINDVSEITFAADYTITLVGRQLPAVASAMSINGNGVANTIIEAGAAPNTATYRVLEVSGTGDLTLDGLTVRNGRCKGSCATSGNWGGGIYNAGALTVSDVTFSTNSATFGGGLSNQSSDATLTNVTFSSNSVTGAGGGLFNNSSSPTLTNVTFSSNSAAAAGGGLFNESSSPMLTNVTFSGNSATNNGGGIYNQNSSPTLTNVTFSSNSTSGSGGGLDNNSSNPTLMNVTFKGNSAASGGGMYNFVSSPTLTNVTFSTNSATTNGGGMSNVVSSPTLTNVTFSTNSATANGGGVFNYQSSPTLTNTIIANSTSGGDCVSAFGALNASSSNNLIEGTGTNSCGLTNTNSNIIGQDPKLGALANNGGLTQTMALGMGSPAIDAGDDANCPAADQRGLTRPQGSHCDIGAYEYKAANSMDTTGVFRPSNGALYLKHQNTTGFADVQINYGIGGDYPVVGDWDGNGTVTIGIYRNGSFYLRNENTIGFADVVFPFGAPGDQPVAGDWDGDGIDTVGVYRNGTFFLRNENSAGAPDTMFGLGVPGDVGIAGDWDGDGIDTTGVFRPSNGALYLKNQNMTGFADIQINYGIGGDKPVTGDWDGDGIDTIGVYRNGQFYLRNSNTIGFADLVFALGVPSDHPIAGNWDGLP